ncbi:MAG: hypothetical protein P4L71_18530 [Acetobacteraceae bacterium]|nr:hypothetical protein [Acetobacteraceae bacterium]
MACLLTWLGNFVCYDRAIHRLVHVPWDQITATCPLADVTLVRAIDQRVVAADLSVPGNDPALGPGPVLQQRLVATPRSPAINSRIVSLSTGTHYLCANPYNEVVADREQASDWEHFLVVEPDEVADLIALLGSRWILHSTGEIVERSAIAVVDGFRVRFGRLMLQLAEILPLTHARRFEGPGRMPFHSADLFVDGWKVERVSLYRPLIYFAVFAKDDVYEQLRLSLQSLVEFGGYTDDVLVMADRPPEQVRALVPPELQARTHVLSVRVRRGLDYMMARYRVADWEPAATCQPLLYVDTDIVFDAAVAPLLAELARHPLITAPQEATRVADSPQLGCIQVEADGIAVGDRLGFNAGTQGFANLTVQGGSLRLVLDALQRWDRDQVARGAPVVWEDQPMANYIAVKTGCYDTELMSRYIRFDHPLYRQGPVTSPDGRRGMVHFWGPPTYREKCVLMEAYVERLRAARTDAPDIAVDASLHGVLPAWPRADSGEAIDLAVLDLPPEPGPSAGPATSGAPGELPMFGEPAMPGEPPIPGELPVPGEPDELLTPGESNEAPPRGEASDRLASSAPG